eukprot:scaffold15940_cov42-Prasinocladus_malaysianus.AAC.1
MPAVSFKVRQKPFISWLKFRNDIEACLIVKRLGPKVVRGAKRNDAGQLSRRGCAQLASDGNHAYDGNPPCLWRAGRWVNGRIILLQELPVSCPVVHRFSRAFRAPRKQFGASLAELIAVGWSRSAGQQECYSYEYSLLTPGGIKACTRSYS